MHEPICLGLDSALGPIFTPRGLRLSCSSLACLGLSSAPEPIFASYNCRTRAQCVWVLAAHHDLRTFTSCRLEMSCTSPAYLDPGSALGPTFTSHKLGLTRPSLTCLALGSVSESTFTSHGFRLSRLSLECLGLGNTPGPIFDSRGLEPSVFWVQVACSYPFSPLIGSGFHARAQRVWVQVLHLKTR